MIILYFPRQLSRRLFRRETSVDSRLPHHLRNYPDYPASTRLLKCSGMTIAREPGDSRIIGIITSVTRKPLSHRDFSHEKPAGKFSGEIGDNS